jgi:flagellar biosynthesis protein FlhF
VAGRNLSSNAGAGEMAAASEDAMAALVPLARLPLEPGVLFVVGPAGCGKTTTAAKLAARAALQHGRRVVLGQAESLRVGAMEQADIYARHIGVELKPVDGRADLRAAVKVAGNDGLVIVDTGSYGPNDGERLEALRRLAGSAAGARSLVLLPAGLRRDEARAVLERFEPLAPAACGLTMTDERGHGGDLVSALAAAQVPLGLMTDGPRVPDDLQEATPRALVSLLLRPAGAPPRRGELH